MVAVTDKRLFILCSAAIGLLLLSGCLPVPTLPHAISVAPDKDVCEVFAIGEATRADVLLLMGDPHYRLDDDRFFMYEWTVSYGYIIVAGGYTALPIPVTAPHYFCLEFGPDSRLVRREHLIGSLYGNPEKAKGKCMKLSEEQDESEEQ
jgi:hypothetical protein